MAFTIMVYEKDRILFRLLEERLRVSFPDAYIRDGLHHHPDHPDGDDTAVRYLFDNMQYDESEFPSGALPLRKGALVDFRSLVSSLSAIRPGKSKEAGPNMHVLFPFAYIEERESFIESYFGSLRDDCDIPVRIDLMSAMRMAGSDRSFGSLTHLLKAVSLPSFSADKIPEYLNPGVGGYLTAGLPDGQDDVFDAGTDTVILLLEKLKQLSSIVVPTHFVLVVAEGFRTNDMCRICAASPCTHILLPARMNLGGMDEAVAILRRAADGGSIALHYAEDLRKKAVGQ